LNQGFEWYILNKKNYFICFLLMKLKALTNPDINQWTQQILYLSSFSYNSDVISQIINFNSFSSNYEIYKLYKKNNIVSICRYLYADIYR
jgi:hypothetical protein